MIWFAVRGETRNGIVGPGRLTKALGITNELNGR
jgi:3-methyladenine DNA glycosylase Mpg